MAVCHASQPVQWKEVENNGNKKKPSAAGLVDAYSLYLMHNYRPNKYYLIIKGEYSVPEKDVQRCWFVLAVNATSMCLKCLPC